MSATNEKDPLKRLEEWKHASKSHAVTLDHPNGYGAGCWNLILHGPHYLKGADIHVHGVSFYEVGDQVLPDNVVFVGMVDFIADDGEEDDRFPTLGECINAGIDRCEELIRRAKAGEELNLWVKPEEEVA